MAHGWKKELGSSRTALLLGSHVQLSCGVELERRFFPRQTFPHAASITAYDLYLSSLPVSSCLRSLVLFSAHSDHAQLVGSTIKKKHTNNNNWRDTTAFFL